MSIMVNASSVKQPAVMTFNDNMLTVVIAGLALGGAERIVLDWAMRIYPRWSVRIVVLRDHKQEWSVPEYIEVIRIHGKNVIKRLTMIGKELAKRENCTCLCHLLKEHERRALAQGGAFVIPVLHNASNGWLEEAKYLKNSSCVISVSKDCARDLYRNEFRGYSPVIHHFPRARSFDDDVRERWRDEWHIPRDAFVIGMIGAIKPQKNYSFALDVLHRLREKKNAYLVVLGGPIGINGKNEWFAIMEKIHALQLRSYVAFPGFVQDAIQFLPVFDVVLNTSFYEGLSIATLETLINGVPVVASDVGGQGEICHENLTLISRNAMAQEWTDALQKAVIGVIKKPTWANFPSYRLWTLMQLVRDFTPKKRWLFVTANLNSGGAQRSLVNMTKVMCKRRHIEVVVAGNSTSEYFYSELQEGGVTVSRSADSRDSFDHAESLIKKICVEKIGLVCFWNLDPKVKILLMKALHFTQVKFVDVSPGGSSFDELEDANLFQRHINYSGQEFYDRLDVLVLKYSGKHPRGYIGKKVIIPNGVPEVCVYKKNYVIRNNPRIVVNGRIAPTKFLLEIIAAVKILWQRIPSVELHIFGAAEPRCEDYAHQVHLASENDNGKRIFFHGMNFDTITILPNFDVYVVLGQDQGCPNALLEALIAGVPSIGNNDGGTVEQIIHEETGLLTQSRSPQELSEAMYRFIIDRDLAEVCGKNGRIHALKNFSMEVMTEKYCTLFDDLSKKHDQNMINNILAWVVNVWNNFFGSASEVESMKIS